MATMFHEIQVDVRVALDSAGIYLAAKSTSIVSRYDDLLFLLGVLNSKVVNFYYLTVFGGNRLQGGYLRIGPPQLKTIPICANAPKNSRAQVASLAKEMIETTTRLVDARSDREAAYLRNKASTLDREIDALIYKLYGLSEPEIATVDETVGLREPNT